MEEENNVGHGKKYTGSRSGAEPQNPSRVRREARTVRVIDNEQSSKNSCRVKN